MINVSCVIIGRNEYPTFVEAIKRLNCEFKDILHEIIFVNIASTDKTVWWLNNFAELENVTRVDLPKNMGVGHALNSGIDRATGKYIFHIAGDVLPVAGSVIGLKKYLDSHSNIDYLAIHAVVSQGKNKNPPFASYDPPTPIRGLGNFAYGYAMFRREIWDAGCRFPTIGPFAGPFGGFEDAEFANQMYAKGFRCWMFTAPGYYHKPHHYLEKKATTYEEAKAKLDERMRWLRTRWSNIEFDWVHYNNQPPERHIRKIAVIYQKDNTTVQILAPGDYIIHILKNICHIEHFQPGEEPDDYDNYIYIK